MLKTVNEIIPGVELLIYNEVDEAVLRINEEDVIEFHYTPEAAAMFAQIDTAEPIELLELLARLNKSLDAKLEAERLARKAVV
ncbi:hypothetical protein [Sporosarcina sp. OR05]|uniref:hypothetical protein n=1 Tax=Sporosarcina sp. OR05 TaxID=2969819 RepID=UPI00352A717F